MTRCILSFRSFYKQVFLLIKQVFFLRFEVQGLAFSLIFLALIMPLFSTYFIYFNGLVLFQQALIITTVPQKHKTLFIHDGLIFNCCRMGYMPIFSTEFENQYLSNCLF